jgi:hypothetical protein
MTIKRPAKKGVVRRYVPITDWLPSYEWGQNLRRTATAFFASPRRPMRIGVKGSSSSKSVGKIQGGTSKKVKVRPKKPGKIKASFKVTSDNAGGKTVKRRIEVKNRERTLGP